MDTKPKKNKRSRVSAGKFSNAQIFLPQMIRRRAQAYLKNAVRAGCLAKNQTLAFARWQIFQRAGGVVQRNPRAYAGLLKKCHTRFVPTKKVQRSCAPTGKLFQRTVGLALEKPKARAGTLHQHNACDDQRKEIKRSLVSAGNVSNVP